MLSPQKNSKLNPKGDSWQYVEFTVINLATAAELVNLFDVNTKHIPTSPSIPLGVYVTGPMDYNQFVRDIGISPKLVKKIVLLTSNASQMNTPFNILYSNMYGESYVTPRYPNVLISQYQEQTRIAEMNFDTDNFELIFDLNTSFNQFSVAALTGIVMIIYYKEITLSDSLGMVTSIQSCSKTELDNCNGLDIKTEKELTVFGESVITMEEAMKI